MTYPIAYDMLETITKKLDKLSIKAQKYGKKLTYTVSEKSYPYLMEVKAIDYVNHCLTKTGEYTIEAIDITIDTDIICANGWKAIAHIEHTEQGNIVTMIDRESSVNQSWYSIESNCNHCNVQRYRKYTYIVKHENGEYKQVGSSCLKDYTGIDPELLVAFNSLHDEILDDDYSLDHDYHSFERVYSPSLVIALSIDSIAEYGYIKSADKGSTKETVIDSLLRDNKASKQASEQAKQIIDFIVNYTGIDNIINNCKPLVLSNLCKLKHIGLLAYVSLAVKREQEREAEKQNQPKIEKQSEYIGTIGQRIDIDITECILLTSWENQYGMTFLYKMIDNCGNIFIWFASKNFGEWNDETGKYIPFESGKIKATVKDHSEREGVKQTILTRVKAL